MRLLLPLGLVAAVALAGCGKSDAASDSTASTTPAATSATPATVNPAKAGGPQAGADTGAMLTDAGANSQAGTKAGGK